MSTPLLFFFTVDFDHHDAWARVQLLFNYKGFFLKQVDQNGPAA